LELDPCVIFVPSPSVHTDRVTFSATYGSPVTGARIAAIIPPTDDISMLECVSVDVPLGEFCAIAPHASKTGQIVPAMTEHFIGASARLSAAFTIYHSKSRAATASDCAK
jgi:hypothetical protein